MEPRSLKYVAAGCAGELRAGSLGMLVQRVCTDSRQVRAGDLFIALKGDRFDGHEFLCEITQQAETAVVVEQGKWRGEPTGCGVIVVAHTRRALGNLAARYRQDFNLPLVAVAGSNGKTTTKELIASVLRQKFATLGSEASFNNDIGVPLTLLNLQNSHQAGVLEVGTNHPGELAPLVRMIQPQLGVITNIGREHLEFFGDVSGVAAEEGTLAELLPANGKLFLNGDDDWTDRLAQRTRASVVRVGLGTGHDWLATEVKLDERGVTFYLRAPVAALSGEYRINLFGRHQALNALFALAIGAELGLGREDLRKGLADCRPPKMRMQFWEANGVRVLDDCYNANADSMRAALETLRDLPCAGRRVAVLGDMGELGVHSEAAHAEVGRRAAQYGVNYLVAVGKMAAVMASAARAAGLSEVNEFAEVEAAAKAVNEIVSRGDVVLLKASRAMGLERVSAALRGE